MTQTKLTKQELMDTIAVKESQIIDFNGECETSDNECLLSAVQINLDFWFNKKLFTAALQTSSTSDYLAVSSRLSFYFYDRDIYKECEELDDLVSAEEVRETLLEKFGLQKNFDDYIASNYLHDNSMPPNCMNDDSETNEMKRRY